MARQASPATAQNGAAQCALSSCPQSSKGLLPALGVKLAAGGRLQREPGGRVGALRGRLVPLPAAHVGGAVPAAQATHIGYRVGYTLHLYQYPPRRRPGHPGVAMPQKGSRLSALRGPVRCTALRAVLLIHITQAGSICGLKTMRALSGYAAHCTTGPANAVRSRSQAEALPDSLPARGHRLADAKHPVVAVPPAHKPCLAQNAAGQACSCAAPPGTGAAGLPHITGAPAPRTARIDGDVARAQLVGQHARVHRLAQLAHAVHRRRPATALQPAHALTLRTCVRASARTAEPACQAKQGARGA